MKVLDSAKILEMIDGGYRYLKANKATVDALNVFPVPDGDTGTNMSLTMASAVKEVKSVETDDIREILTAYSRGALKGARGNSGVILSQIIKGLAVVLADEKAITTKAFASALRYSREVAYNAVTKPKEGTVLTVIRYMAENAPSIANKNASFINFFDQLIKKGEEILQKTPDMLPVLKQAGVVDAGGRGLLCVFQGFYNVLAGVEIPDEIESEETGVVPTPILDAFGNDEHDLDNIKYAYCTEYFIINLKKHITEEDIEKLRDKLMTIGDCVIVIGDINLVKVHVHTNQPNRALYNALQLGELDKVKIENMLEQHRALVAEREKAKKDIGLISICAGEGIANIFKELTIDEVIEGGQTMNPSVEDILNAVEKINSDNIIILPNNKNIIMAAEKVKELTQKRVEVIPTAEVAQGIRAAFAFDINQSVDVNVEEMKNAYADLKCGEVTNAVRNTNLDGFEISEGDIIGLDGKTIIADSKSVEETTLAVIDKLVDEWSEVITLYYGEGVSKEDVEKLTCKLKEKYEDFDVVSYYGGQPHYYYLISIE
ncbi:MAG: DAK2 domain-containing protein [Clostridia bacterium]|jgi:DAK2 domain fusion protein YloV|nr:DAK2 domain-containing protein [Clostridia bacterium]MCI9290849.1 DAK2 domain-containing protein [Clostridia bacterium]